MTSQPFPVDIPFRRRSRQGQTKSFSLQNAHKRSREAFKTLHDSFTVRLERKTLRLALPTSSCNGNIDRKRLRSSLFPKIDAKNIDREVQPKRLSFSGKMEVPKPFLCSKLSSKSC